MKYYICVGDKTSGGGTVLQGDNSFLILDRPASTVGMQVQCCNAIQTITQGWSGHIIQEKPIAYHGCSISCGCTLISSQTLMGWDDGSDDSSSEQSDGIENSIIQDSPQKYSKSIQIIDDNDKPVANRKYRITATDGTTLEGVTDDNGLTEHVWTHQPENLDIEILANDTFDNYHSTNKG